MTPKELLYIEDALSHEKFLKQKCMDLSNQLQDAQLASCIKELEKKHTDLFNQFYSLV